ncbi:MAG: hypothetical protein MJA29_07715 [Candidatus Omnitrophica bacterium]|nr:hypothetical protein [Candidatus Omnitrophota bacterium]
MPKNENLAAVNQDPETADSAAILKNFQDGGRSEALLSTRLTAAKFKFLGK